MGLVRRFPRRVRGAEHGTLQRRDLDRPRIGRVSREALVRPLVKVGPSFGWRIGAMDPLIPLWWRHFGTRQRWL